MNKIDDITIQELHILD